MDESPMTLPRTKKEMQEALYRTLPPSLTQPCIVRSKVKLFPNQGFDNIRSDIVIVWRLKILTSCLRDSSCSKQKVSMSFQRSGILTNCPFLVILSNFQTLHSLRWRISWITLPAQHQEPQELPMEPRAKPTTPMNLLKLKLLRQHRWQMTKCSTAWGEMTVTKIRN